MSSTFDDTKSFQGGYLETGSIAFFKIKDTTGNLICAAATVNGSIAPYNQSYTEIRMADIYNGVFPRDEGGLEIIDNYYGVDLPISLSSATENIAFKFKHAATSVLYNVTITGVFDNVTYTNASVVPIKSATTTAGYGGYGALFEESVEPIIFTVDLTGGGGADTEKPVITSGTAGNNLVENTGPGQTIYTITATDNVAVTGYAIGGTDASLLSVNSGTGVVTLTANPNYESKSSYSFTVTATDGTNTSDPVTVTFSITNANESTTGIPAITLSGTGSLASPLVGDTLTATQGNIADPDGLGAFSYQWKNSSGATVLGTNSTYTIQQSDKDYTITVSVSFTDGGVFAAGPLTSNATGTVAAPTSPNSPATGLPTITGTASVGQILTANLGTIADTDGLPGSYTYQWKRGGSAIGGEINATYTVAEGDIGTTLTVTVSFTDNATNLESLTSAGTSISALDDKTYFWTVYNDASNNTAIYYGIYNTTKITGVQFTYDISGATTLADVSYNQTSQTENNTMIYKKEWPIHIINNTNDVANKSMVFAGAVNQSINGMNTGVFAIISGYIVLKTIVGITDNNANFLADTQYALGAPANPPEITEPGGRPLGDINYDGSFNDIDINIMTAYLLNDTDTSFNVYGGDAITVLHSGKTAIEIIGTIVVPGIMSEYDILTYIDVNNNNILDVGDLVRMLSKRANPSFNMINGTY